MAPLPQPDDLTSLVLRADFTDDAAWDAVQAAIVGSAPFPNATFVSDTRFDAIAVEALVEADAAAGEDEQVTYLFLVDAVTLTDHEYPLLAVDLYDEPGRTFRVPPRWYHDVSANLSISNMDFSEFADAADTSGTFRGFGD